MTYDDLEFSISQYLDGTLPAAERDALETRLGRDAGARALFAEYEAVQQALAAAPLPAVQWDRLAGQISAAVAREEMPAPSYKLTSWLRPARLAVAASALLVAGIVYTVVGPRGGTIPASPTSPPIAKADEPIRIVAVDRPPGAASPTNVAAVTPAINPEPVVVAVGPPTSDDRAVVRVYADTVVRRPSKAVIVRPARPDQDAPQPPF